MAQSARHTNQKLHFRWQKAKGLLKPVSKIPTKHPQRRFSSSASRIRFTPVPVSIIFKTAILITVLIVATIAMVYEITDAVVWAFLTMIAGYAALSSEKKEK